MVINKYLVGFIQLALIALTALQTAIAAGWNVTAAWQFAGFVVGAIVTVFVPLTRGAWAGSLKVGGAVIGALIAAIVPFITMGWTANAVVIVILAAVNALATQLGVYVRVDSAKQALASTSVSDAVPLAVDPTAADVAALSQVPSLD